LKTPCHFATIIKVVPDHLIRKTEPEFEHIPRALMAHAVDTFGDPVKARAWLTTPNPVLSNLQPLEIAMTSEGVARVEEVLTRIDYGIFS
jgi:putative toxin-antitoxin system antitoxin component (TIGR02293 family)